ncbi:MAG TPA: hypothetical protein VIW68_15085 [Candidatus Sulfotelmatobacter sp.]
MPLLLSLLLVICALMCAVGCSRPGGLTSDDAANPADQNKLPFQDNAAKGTSGAGSDSGAGNSRDANGAQSANRDGRPTGSAPFQTLSSIPELPPGTLVTVRLEKQISTDRASAEATFTAVVDEPVLVDGKIAVPRGAFVTGEIESAPASDVGPGRGYIRLTLDTITIAGKKLPLRTSSLFVRGSAGEVLSSDSAQDQDEPTSPTVKHLQTGRRLTFRLAATVPLYRQQATSSGQNRVPGTER